MSIIKGIKVGSADITSTYDVLSDSETLSVVAVNVQDVASIDAISSTVYNGSAQTPQPTVTATIDEEVVTLVKDTDYTLSYSNNTTPGTASVIITGIGNYTGTKTANWTISPAAIVVDTTDQTYTYNGNPQGSGITVSLVDSGEPTVRYGLTDGTYDLSSVPQFTNVNTVSPGNYIVYYKVSADNHSDATGSYTVTINPKTAELQWTDTYWRYDGEPHGLTCTVSNLVSGDTCNVILSNNSRTDIGSQTVSATGLSNDNYVLGEYVTATLTILGGLYVNMSGTWTPVKKVYQKVGNGWIEQTNLQELFSTSEKYKKMN